MGRSERRYKTKAFLARKKKRMSGLTGIPPEQIQGKRLEDNGSWDHSFWSEGKKDDGDNNFKSHK